ncbi:hypothetical protein C1H46_019671 [Malus baccata]|uniref:Serine-rich protein-like protein n=1 Tax=Malus baccata TaxID=106549 RepID=A0A540M7R4_MALBA|nr:hypothetical protein C1H46_019671 [Malus baccata]
MATASYSSRARTRSNGSGPVLRSLSPSGRFYAASNGSASGFASSTSSSFSSPASAFYQHHQDHHYYNQQIHNNHHHHHRSASPTRVNLYTSSSPSPSVRFSIDHRSISPNHHSNRSIAVSKKSGPISMPKKTCMCSPTSHPGSFRCSLHKNQGGSQNNGSFPSNRLNMRRSAMTNSLVRIGGVEGEWVKRALTALIRPCAHQQRRRAGFQPRPSRLSVMTTAHD